MAQQSARRDRDNQAATPYFEYATLIWTRSANSHAGRRSMAAQEAGQMAASDYVPISFKNRLHLAGRPQMGSRPSTTVAFFA